MSMLLRAMDTIEFWWCELPSHYQWFVGCVATAVVMGVGGGMLG